MNLRVGTSGFAYREWVGRFYPPGFRARDMLAFYAERFSAVEINATFYRMPILSVLESWELQVPEEFIFTFKAPGSITHRKRLRNAEEETALFMTRISALGGRLGPVLFQLPPSLTCDLHLLDAFLEGIPRRRIAFEFRHPSWFRDDLFDILRESGCALCISDRDGAPSPPVIATTDFGYVRLRRSQYAERDLLKWKEKITEQGWEETFVFFRHEETAKGPEFAEGLIAAFRVDVEDSKRKETAHGR